MNENLIIDPQNEPLIQKIFSSKAVGMYKKKTPTFLRRPLHEEIGKTLTTYINNNKESVSIIDENSVIARNEKPLEGRYNEWVISYSDAIEDYGKEKIDSLSSEFIPLYKKHAIKAIRINGLLLKFLGYKTDKLLIKVPLSKEPMTGLIGDYLTDSGYIISNQFIDTYELIEQPEKDADVVLMDNLRG